MRRYLFLITAAVLLLSMVCAAEADTTIAYEELPQAHRTLYENAMSTARTEASKRAPGQNVLRAMARGDFSGYTDLKSDNSLQVEYRVSDSVVKVGEKIKFYVNVSCEYPPMIYTVSGLVFDEGFNQTGSLNSSGTSTRVEEAFKSVTFFYTPTVPGYVNFVFAVSDGNANQVSVITSTVMVCEADDPIFQNQSLDINTDTSGNLGLMLSLDRAKLSVGTLMTAYMDVTTSTDPVRYRAVWTLLDDAGNIIDTSETNSEVSAQTEQTRVALEYRPLQSGKRQLVINASDGEGNRVKTNTPVITVGDGYYLTVKLNPTSAVVAGSSLSATYNISGHACSAASYSVRWTCSDAEGNVLASTTQAVSERSGKVTYTPLVGQEVACFVSAACEHFPDADPAAAYIALVGGQEDGLNGDANNDGVVSAADVLLIMQREAGWPVRISTDNADADGSGSVNLSDAVEILRGIADGTLQ